MSVRLDRRAVDPMERYQLAVALRPREMAPLLQGCWPELARSSRAGTACKILDAKYEPGARCTILYELGRRLVMGHLAWPCPPPVTDTGRAVHSVGMVAYLFPDDPFLPGLGTAMDDNAMKRVVGEVLPACREGQVRVLRCRVTALRYRPGRRCTVRAEVSLRATGSRAIASVVLFAKLYHDRDKAAAVFEDSAAVSRSESLRSEGVVVATPIGFVPKLAMVLNESVAGAPLQAWLAGASYGNKDESRVRQGLIGAARGVASLHSSAVESNRHRPPARVAVERMARRSARVAMVDAGLGRRMERLAAALLDLLEGFAQSSSEVTFVHGDCKPSQFLIDGRDIAMLDFDHCGMADPASDVGSFTASIRQQRVRAALAGAKGAATPPAPLVLEKLFVDEYCDRRKADVDFRRRVRWYEASALLRKAYRAFQRSPRSALCPALVDEGWLSLQSLSSGRLERVGASTR